jgi:hypothetical protein
LKYRSDFAKFEIITGRVDALLYSLMATNTFYCNLWFIVKQLLLLSHGQAAVGRGFSVIPEVESESIYGMMV